jgi:putative aldouronate transport system permease protein
MLPWYIVCVNVIHIQNSVFALFVPYAVNVWNLFLLRNYFQSIPEAINESAVIDGANQFTIFIKLVIPLSKTAVLTVAMFYAIQFWNDWWLPIMLVTNNKLFPLQYYLFSLLTSAQALSSGMSMNASNIRIPTETIKMATTIITLGPIVLLFPLIQKYFVKGIVIGAVKG